MQVLDFRSGSPTLCSPPQVAPSFKASRLKVGTGLAKPLSSRSPTGLDLGEVFDIGVDPLGKHDLAGFCGVAQARGEVQHGADGAVVKAALEADLPERRVPPWRSPG